MDNTTRMVLAMGERPAERYLSTTRISLDFDDRARLIHASREAQLALEATILASTEAITRARVVSAQLDARLADVTRDVEVGVVSHGDLAMLSPREKEVLALVAAGHSNKAIASALFLSPNTVKTHVSSLLSKLQAETRVHLAVIAAQFAPLNA